MRLVNYGIGEVSDRVSILTLKVLYGEAAGKDTKHWQTERATLLAKLGARDLSGAWIEAYTELAAVNAVLWQGEDELRGWRDQEADSPRLDPPIAADVAALAFRIQGLNDRRAALIETINKATGEHLGSEKLT